jgi:phage virion morphogenesis protein
MELSVKIDAREVQALLLRLQRRVSDMSKPMGRIGVFYERSVLANFKAQASPAGTPWAKLSKTTMLLGLGKKKGWKKDGGLSAKGKRYLQGKRILWEHGDLEGAVHHQADSNSVTIGVGGHIPYAAIHQFGGMAGRGKKVKIPARPYLAVNRGKEMEFAEKDRVRIMDIIREHLRG